MRPTGLYTPAAAGFARDWSSAATGCFLDRMEPDPAGGWRLHFFMADDAALPLLDELTEGAFGLGDPANLDPEKFVSERIRLGRNTTPIREFASRTFSCRN